MASIHEIKQAKDGDQFTCVGPVTIQSQYPPKLSKNNKRYSNAVLKTSSNEISITLWNEASMWKLPIGVEITLRGTFFKRTYDGKVSITCEKITQPENAVLFNEVDVQGQVIKPSIRSAIDAGLWAAGYVAEKDQGHLRATAFSFAAKAFLDGHKTE